MTVGLRPEHLSLDGGGHGIGLVADLTESLGGTTLIHAQTASGETMMLQAPGRVTLGKGERFRVGFDPGHAYVFDAAGRAL